MICVVLANRQQVSEGREREERLGEKPCKVVLRWSWFRNSTGPREGVRCPWQMLVPAGKQGRGTREAGCPVGPLQLGGLRLDPRPSDQVTHGHLSITGTWDALISAHMSHQAGCRARLLRSIGGLSSGAPEFQR